MDEEKFNMSLRKFLKQVGVTSQREIERLVRARGPGTGPRGGPLKLKAVPTAAGTGPTGTRTGSAASASGSAAS